MKRIKNSTFFLKKNFLSYNTASSFFLAEIAPHLMKEGDITFPDL